MKRKSLFSILLTSLALVVSSCGPTGDPSSSLPGSSVPGSSEGGTSSEPSSEGGSSEGTGGSSVSEVENYEAWINEWSQPGHLYIHYNRPTASEAEYDKYAIWIWQNAPLDLEGSLWGASDATVQEKFHVMTTSWMTNIGGSGNNIDQYGRIIDIDLTRKDIIGGKSGQPVSFEGASRVGFLIVDQTSMGGGKHWVSDGLSDMFITDFQSHWRSNGSMHIFATQGSVQDYTFESGQEVEVNPIVTDTTGAYRSENNVDSSAKINKITKTSESFKDKGVGYQIFVASYRDSNGDGLGDIRGIIDALPELKELGVEVLWLTPVQESGSYHGYDTIDFFSIDSKFGTLEDYRELMFKAHKNGMSVLMDLVLNHTSPNNVWFKKSQKGIVEKDALGNEINYRNFYHWRFEDDLVKWYNGSTYENIEVQNHPDWYRDGESKYYYYGKFGSNMPELNYDNLQTRELVKSLAKYWLGFGLDGFRLDAVKHIYMNDEIFKTNPGDTIISDIGSKTYYDEEKMETVTTNFDYSSNITKNLNFWKDFALDVKSVYPNCFLVGENFDGYGARIAPYYQALDSQFDFNLYYHIVEQAYNPNTSLGMGAWLGDNRQNETYGNYNSSGMNGIYVNGQVAYQLPKGNRSDFINGAFTSNHDVDRAINHVMCPDTAGSTYVVTGTETEYNRAKVAAAITLLQPGLSWIYYGDELGMSGNIDTHVSTYGNENNKDLWYRQPFKWGDDSITTGYSFNRYTVGWDNHNKILKSYAEQKANATDNDVYDIYKQLCEIKAGYGKNAKFTSTSDQSNLDVMIFEITTDTGSYKVWINCGKTNRAYSINLSGYSRTFLLNGATSTSVGPYQIAVAKR